MFEGALNPNEWLDQTIGFGQRFSPQADSQSRAGDLERTNGHTEQASDFVAADSPCQPVFDSCDIFVSEFAWLSALNQPAIFASSRIIRRRHKWTFGSTPLPCGCEPAPFAPATARSPLAGRVGAVGASRLPLSRLQSVRINSRTKCYR